MQQEFIRMTERDAKVEKLLRKYPVVLDWPVAWGDMDAFQHVNNVQYFHYFENVRVSYGDVLGLGEHKRKTGVGPILADAHITYVRPVTYPDTLALAVRVAKIEPTQWRMEFLAVSHGQKCVVAKGDCITVFFDYNNTRRTNIPEGIVAKCEKLEGRSFQL